MISVNTNQTIESRMWITNFEINLDVLISLKGGDKIYAWFVFNNQLSTFLSGISTIPGRQTSCPSVLQDMRSPVSTQSNIPGFI